MRFEITKRRSIEEDRESTCGNALINPSNEFVPKPMASLDFKNEAPLNLVKSLLHIYFNSHLAISLSLSLSLSFME